jgi:hypothetical protein
MAALDKAATERNQSVFFLIRGLVLNPGCGVAATKILMPKFWRQSNWHLFSVPKSTRFGIFKRGRHRVTGSSILAERRYSAPIWREFPVPIPTVFVTTIRSTDCTTFTPRESLLRSTVSRLVPKSFGVWNTLPACRAPPWANAQRSPQISTTSGVALSHETGLDVDAISKSSYPSHA